MPDVCRVPYCGQPPEPGKKACRYHLQQQKLCIVRQMAKKRAAGLCRYGGCHTKPAGGHSYCNVHRAYFRKRYHARKRAGGSVV